MKTEYDSTRLEELLVRLFDESLTEPLIDELNQILSHSAAAREHYRRSQKLHAALIRNRASHEVPSSHKIPSRRMKHWVTLAAAACILLGSAWWLSSMGKPAAHLSGVTSATWQSGATPVSLTQPQQLNSGFAQISFRSGVNVILEGPCQFQVTSDSSMKVSHGRATVKVPHHLDGFHLDTPAGRITDLGTEFGVAVGTGSEGPVILTEVFDGEIEIPAENTPRKRLLSGEALAIVKETNKTRLISTLGDYRVDLGDSARQLPKPSERKTTQGNLAAGKPVSSPAWYVGVHGNSFPPDNLTDGRFNDTGSPGDWSFWLAPNGDSGEFTLDLLDSFIIGRIELQNTRNRTHGDRGFCEISIQVSSDNQSFREIFRGELQRIMDLPSPGVDFPIESIRFDPVRARYLKVVGFSHYRKLDRPLTDPNEGGGLNEIQVFAP